MASPSSTFTQWIHEIKPLPGGWTLRLVILGAIVFFLLGDLFTGTFELSSWRGVLDMVLPYIPLVTLTLSGALYSSIAWFLTLGVVLLLGAPGYLTIWLLFPNAVVAAFCCFLLPWKTALTFCGLSLVSISALLVPPDRAFDQVLLLGVTIFAASIAGLSLNVYRRRQERSVHRILDLEEQQRQVRQEERTRLAHELHDIVAHDVTVMAMQARRVEYTKEPEKMAKILHSIGDSAQQTLHDLRSLVVLLKEEEKDAPGGSAPQEDSSSQEQLLDTGSMSGETTTAVGFLHDLDGVVEALQSSGFEVVLSVKGEAARIPASQRQALRRTVRELGTNIMKHSRPGSEVGIELHVAGNQVRLSASNEVSSGKPIVSSRTGIEAMHARCEVFGGQVVAGVEDGVWTTTVSLPLEVLLSSSEERSHVG